MDNLVPCSNGRKLTSFLGWQQAAWNYSACSTGQESSKQPIFREQMSHRNLSPHINETHYSSKSYKPVFSSVLYRDGASCCHLRGQRSARQLVYRWRGSCFSCLERQEILPWKRTDNDKLPSSNSGLFKLHRSSQATMPDVQCLQGRAHKQLQMWPRSRSCFALSSPTHTIILQDQLHLGIFPQFQQKRCLTDRPRGFDDGPSEAVLMFHQNKSE